MHGAHKTVFVCGSTEWERAEQSCLVEGNSRVFRTADSMYYVGWGKEPLDFMQMAGTCIHKAGS